MSELSSRAYPLVTMCCRCCLGLATEDRMKSATQVLAAIAAGGALAGGTAAIMQVPAPKTATTAAVTTSTSDQAIQALTDVSTQLHAAVSATQAQLASLQTTVTGATAGELDPTTLLAQTQAQLATAQQRLAADEALLAKLQPKTQAATAAPGRTEPSQHAETPSTTPSRTPSTTPSPTREQETAATVAATTAPPARHTYSGSPGPTN